MITTANRPMNTTLHRPDGTAWEMRSDIPEDLVAAVWPHGGHTYHARADCIGIPVERRQGLLTIPRSWVQIDLDREEASQRGDGLLNFCGICLMRQVGEGHR